ncbi:MAG: carbon storage regulator [Acidiferrobacteraceae bacterium]
MLVLTRRVGESLRIYLDDNIDLTMPVGQLFADGPIEVMVVRCSGSQVKIGVAARSEFIVLRSELDRKPHR